MPDPIPHIPVAVVGAGQAGLSISYHLKARGIEHLVFEKRRALHVWSERRWDSFCLVTPNWQCNLPGHVYSGADPHGFMVKDEIIAYLAGFASAVDAPLREGVSVERVTQRESGGFDVSTSEGDYVADHVVAA